MWATPFCFCLYALVIDAVYALVRGDRPAVIFGVTLSRVLLSSVLAAAIVLVHVPLRLFPPTAAKTGSFIRMSVADLVTLVTLAPGMSALDRAASSGRDAERREAKTFEGMVDGLRQRRFHVSAVAPRRHGGVLVGLSIAGISRVIVVREDGVPDLVASSGPFELGISALHERADGTIELLGGSSAGFVRATLDATGVHSIPVTGADAFLSDRFQVAWHEDGVVDLVRTSVNGVYPGVVLRIGKDGAARALPFAPPHVERESYELPSIGVDGAGTLYVAYNRRGPVDETSPFATLEAGVWRFSADEPEVIASASRLENIEAMYVRGDGRLDLLLTQPRIELPHAESNTPLVLRRYDADGVRKELVLPSSGLRSDALLATSDGGIILVRDFKLVRIDAALVEQPGYQQTFEATAHDDMLWGTHDLLSTLLVESGDGVIVSVQGSEAEPARLPLLHVDAQGHVTRVLIP